MMDTCQFKSISSLIQLPQQQVQDKVNQGLDLVVEEAVFFFSFKF